VPAPGMVLGRGSVRFFRVKQLRRMRGSEQVAAVCYRARKNSIEFLLVQTRRGRWTFPKGSAEPGLTSAQAAALEAFEEAGVHGRMEEVSFIRYELRKRSSEVAVHAHLCEVLRLDRPPETGRNPTWFSPEKAKRRLQSERDGNRGEVLAAVVDQAVMRIQRALTGKLGG